MDNINEQKLIALETFAKETPTDGIINAADYILQQALLLRKELTESQSHELLSRLNSFLIKLQNTIESPPGKKDFLAVAAIMKDEAAYLAEWLEYHLLIGVTKFYLYDNGSTDDTSQVLIPYIKEGIVEHIQFDGVAQQLNAYSHCLVYHSKKTEWLTFIDIDEFLASTGEQNLIDFLADLPADIGQLFLNWCIFNSSGHLTKPTGLVIENYKTRTAGHNHFKCILRTKAINLFSVKIPSPHFVYNVNGRSVYENLQEIPEREMFQYIYGPHRFPEKFAVFHYYMKSKEEFMIRRSGITVDSGKPHTFLNDISVEEAFIKLDKGEAVWNSPPPFPPGKPIDFNIYDTVMDKYINPVKEAIAKRT